MKSSYQSSFLFLFIVTVTALPAPVRQETGINIRSGPATRHFLITRSIGMPDARFEHNLLVPREPKDASKAAQDKKQVQQAAQTQAQNKGQDMAIKGAETAVKDAAKKAAVAVGTTIAVAAVPVLGEVIDVAKTLANIVEEIVGAVEKINQAAHAKESQFTKDIVTKAYGGNSKWNYLMINEKLKQNVKMQGTEGKEWAVGQRKVSPAGVEPVTYHFYTFGAATVTDNGDEGYLNWAWTGNFKRDGKTVTFTKPA